MYDFDKNDDLSWMIQDFEYKKPRKIKKYGKKNCKQHKYKKIK